MIRREQKSVVFLSLKNGQNLSFSCSMSKAEVFAARNKALENEERFFVLESPASGMDDATEDDITIAIDMIAILTVGNYVKNMIQVANKKPLVMPGTH